MEVILRSTGKREILDKSNFLASGGQGQIFVKNDNVAYKIYTDPSKALPIAKINELSVLVRPNIIRPLDIIIDKNNKPVGYTMIFVKNTYALCQLFTKAFKNRMSVTKDIILDLVKKLQDTIKYIHDNDILVVDLNEMNVLVSSKLDDLYMIDIDSYQTKSFPATAIMESIRDRHATCFDKNTDYFAFGILSFQMMIGIHPFRGSHPKIKDLDGRMMKNISVFDKDVSIPKICESFDVIPTAYKQWYKAIFDEGKRLPPPSDFQTAVVIIPIVHTVIGSDKFIMNEIMSFSEDIIDYKYIDGVDFTTTGKGLYYGKRLDENVSANSCVAITPRQNHIISCSIKDDMLCFYDVTTGKNLVSNMAGESVMSYNGRLYVKNDLDIMEIDFVELPNDILPAAVIVGNVMPKATTLYDGVIIQDLFGSYYVSIFPMSKTCYQFNLKELNGYKIVDAKYDNNALMVVGTIKGDYDKFIFRFSPKYDSYTARIENKISYTGINFVVLDNGVCVYLNDEEKLEIFLNKYDSTDIKVIEDDVIKGDKILFKKGTQLLFSSGKKLFSLAMKK